MKKLLTVFLIVSSYSATAQVGSATVLQGTATQAGYIEWRKPGGVRQAYMGWDPSVLNLNLEAGHNLNITGGKLGIGIASPQAPLDIAFQSTTTAPHLNLRRSGAGDVGISFQQNGVTAFGIVNKSGGGLAFVDNYYTGIAGSTKMFIKSVTGEVGIGTTSPLYPLHVMGRISSDQGNDGGMWCAPNRFVGAGSDFVGLFNAGWNLVLKPDGKVGIGTTTPTARLHVAGTSRLDDDMYFGNWRISKNASSSTRDHIGYFAGANKNIMGLAYDINSGNSIIGLAHHGGAATTSYPVGTIRLASQTALNNGKKESILVGGIGGIYVDPGELSFGIGFDYGVTLANGNPDHDAVFIIRNPRHHRTQIELLSAAQTGDLLKINGEVCITANGTCDYVFKDDYKLRSIEELEKFILKNGHLPGVKNDKEIKEAGMVNVLEQSNALLEKTEEFSLYIIELNKRLKQQQELIEQQQKVLAQLMDGNKRSK